MAQYFPRALTAVANVSKYGLDKYDLVYSDVNWQRVDNGINRYADALGRHLLGYFIDPEGMDPESNLSHLHQMAWNCLALVELHERQKSNKTTK